jgi:glycosyltransferase involved in cell wall biosynthesis
VTYFQWILGSLLALIWLSRVVDTTLGVRTLVNISHPEWDRHPATPAGNPRVVIIVPARNEGASIGEALSRMLALDYDNYELIAVDDRSTDHTGEIMEGVESTSDCRLKVVHVRELPSGWMGKAHAMWTAARQADSDWLLFTDADVMFRPDCLRRAIAYAEAERADHLVLFPRTIMKRPGEKMMLAFFQLMFVFGHRPWKVADPRAKDHIGVGAFNLVRKSVYEAVGTYEALRFEVVDDLKLGKVIKNAGFRQRNVIGGDLLEIRWARGARGVVRNLTKNFFAVMSYQWWRAVLFCAAAAIGNLMPSPESFSLITGRACHTPSRSPACSFFMQACRLIPMCGPGTSCFTPSQPCYSFTPCCVRCCLRYGMAAWSGAAPSTRWMS